MKNRALAISALALLALGAATSASAGTAKERNPPIDERALKGNGATILGPSVVTPEDTVMYSGDTTGEPTYNRALADCSGLSGVGTAVNYQVQDFTVGTSGNYDITSVQGYDGFIHLYTNAFNPAAALTNCTAGSDDGSGGIGTSEILGVPLTAGTTYFVVTSGFANTDFGTYDNTLSGPGTILLGGQGPDLAITKSTLGVVFDGLFDYDLTLTNNGPGADTGIVVTDVLPGAVGYVSDNCGGGAAGQIWTWNVGGLAEGASVTCTITVQGNLQACGPVSNTVRISSDGGGGAAGNNTSTISNVSESIQDGGFEDGTPNGFWTEASTNFGTPVCDVPSCGSGGGSGPHAGTFWTWFGGTASNEEGSMTQSVTFPAAGPASLTFFLEVPVCDPGSGADDFMEVTVDGTQVFLVTAASPLCGSAAYSLQSVDVSAWADGGAHTVEFHSITTGQIVNFFVDDVSMTSTTCVEGQGPPPPPAEVPTLGGAGFVALAGLLALAGFVALRRRTA